MKFSEMTDQDLFNAMALIAETCRNEADFIDEMRKGTFKFPRDPAARAQAIESHQKIIAKMKQEADEMYAELMRRWEKFTGPA